MYIPKYSLKSGCRPPLLTPKEDAVTVSSVNIPMCLIYWCMSLNIAKHLLKKLKRLCLTICRFVLVENLSNEK